MSACPLAHSSHVVAPCGANVPLSHAVHGVAGSLSRSASPDTHATQTVAAVPAYSPCEHSVHGVAGSLSRSAVPSTQSVQSEDALPPGVPRYVPTAQAMQYDGAGPAALDAMEYRPVAQSPEH